MRIRDYRAADRPAVTALHQELQTYERAFRPSRAVGAEVSERQVAEYLSMMADDAEDARLIVAERDGALIGFAFFLFETEALESASSQVYVQDFMVTQSARRQGVGAALMDVIRQAMRGKNASVIDLQVLVGNEAAAAFYRAQGFDTAYLGLKANVPGPSG